MLVILSSLIQFLLDLVHYQYQNFVELLLLSFQSVQAYFFFFFQVLLLRNDEFFNGLLLYLIHLHERAVILSFILKNLFLRETLKNRLKLTILGLKC